MQKSRTNFASAFIEHKKLLSDLVLSVTALLSGAKEDETVSNTDALLCVHSSIEQILLNGFRIRKPDGSSDLWRFFEGLNWLNPSMTDSITRLSPHIHIPYSRIRKDKSLTWIYESLEGHQLPQKLKILISDTEHLENCYEVTSFLRARAFPSALFVCLDAITKKQLKLLSQIDKSLLNPTNDRQINRHRRASSHPDYHSSNNSKITLTQEAKANKSAHGDVRKSKSSDKKLRKKTHSVLNRPWRSLPNLQSVGSHIVRPTRSRCQTISSQPIQIPRKKTKLVAEALASLSGSSITDRTVPSFSYSTKHNQIPSDSGSSCATPIQPITLVKCDDIEIHFDYKFTPLKEGSGQTTIEADRATNATKSINSGGSSFSPRSMDFLSCIPSPRNLLPLFSDKSPLVSEKPALGIVQSEIVNTFVPQQGEKIKNRYRTISEDGGFELSQPFNSGKAPDNGVTLRPVLGQSLTSYLRAAQFTRANTELERENAHFSVSEAMIAAIEQVKWCKQEKERLKLQRRRDMGTWQRCTPTSDDCWERRKFRRLKKWSCDGEDEAEVNTYSSDNEAEPSEKGDDDNTTETSNDSSTFIAVSDLNTSSDSRGTDDYLQTLSVSTQNINDHQAYAEWEEINNQTLSAESVALSLITKFSDKQLPRASDLLWLVSEQEAPQRMLPMPDGWSVDPDDNCSIATFTRGTRDWAPPRRQIIFTRHPQPNRKKILFQQNMRCAGCGMKVAIAYSNIFRYCDYLGKYFCTGCHRNQISTIPARILDNWDFSMHPVSVFSYRLLDQITTYALYHVEDVAPSLYKKVRMLRGARFRRYQLKYIQDFIMTCRFADHAQQLFNKIPNYITTDLDLWSISDFVSIKNGHFNKNIGSMIEQCEQHINSCELCMARGFICERCRSKGIIFPWQQKVRRCPDCGCCAHSSCWKKDSDECSKCIRLKSRLNI